VRSVRVGDRVQANHGGNGTGTAIELRADKVLVSFYASGAQLWFDLTEVVKSGINPRK
jgi:hypothetical protein